MSYSQLNQLLRKFISSEKLLLLFWFLHFPHLSFEMTPQGLTVHLIHLGKSTCGSSMLCVKIHLSIAYLSNSALTLQNQEDTCKVTADTVETFVSGMFGMTPVYFNFGAYKQEQIDRYLGMF